MLGQVTIKILAKIVIGVERVRHAFRRMFPRRITVVRHLAILRDMLNDVQARHEAELADLKTTLDFCETEGLATAEAYKALHEEAESLRAVNKNLQANIVYYQGDNASLRAVIADAEAFLREKAPSIKSSPHEFH